MSKKTYSKNDIIKELDAWEKVMESADIFTFRFQSDPDHDINLIEWFCAKGEMRVYRDQSTKNSYRVFLCTPNGLKISLGSLYSGLEEGDHWGAQYIIKTWNLLGKFIFCTNNLLKTPDEVVNSFGGNEDYRFSNSKETKSSMLKHTIKVEQILNNIK
jgi:hypothetical protein